MKPTGPTNPYLKQLVEELKQKSRELKAPIWKAVAKNLERPRRRKVEVNVYKIERNAKENETVIVPGVVLGSGEIKKPVRVAAWRFSPQAEEKIRKAGGTVMKIEDVLKENPKGSNVKILV
ncbi:MAG: 50S ribosomal protein L18e [Candidatus Aenigmatarchaeota archaeon]